MERHEALKRLAELGREGENFAVATVVRTYGSTPREVGAKMLIRQDGTFQGTIGGGCGEAEVWQAARDVLSSGSSTTVHVDLTEDPDQGGEAICGGRMDVFVEVWRVEDHALAEAAARLLQGAQGLALATVIHAPQATSAHGSGHLLVHRDGQVEGAAWPVDRTPTAQLASAIRQRLETGLGSGLVYLPPQGEVHEPRQGHSQASISPTDWHVFIEVIEAPPHLVIAGAGHCALPLARLGRMLGFRITILDDRPECATAERFPDADQILVGDLAEQMARLSLDKQTYLVLVTRGHKLDEVLLRQALRRPAAYIGMIGSRRRTRAVLADLRRDGFEAPLLAKVCTPIGLDIGAETPEEIAVSILAEVIRTRRGGTGLPLSSHLRGASS